MVELVLGPHAACKASMQGAHPQVTLSEYGSPTRGQELAVPTRGAASPLWAQRATQGR